MLSQNKRIIEVINHKKQFKISIMNELQYGSVITPSPEKRENFSNGVIERKVGKVFKKDSPKDPKKIIAALRGEITKNTRKYQEIIYFYEHRNLFQRIFNKLYEK